MAFLKRPEGKVPLFLVVIAAVSLAARGDEPVVDEYRLKAAFVYNFAKFIDWPPDAFRIAQDPMVICVLARSPFRDSLVEIVHGKTLGDRSLVVREISVFTEDSGCHILVVASSEVKRFYAMVAKVHMSEVLTIGETPGFATDGGGVINFIMDGGKIRFEINVEAAHRQQLQISSKLLGLAQIIKR